MGVWVWSLGIWGGGGGGLRFCCACVYIYIYVFFGGRGTVRIFRVLASRVYVGLWVYMCVCV